MELLTNKYRRNPNAMIHSAYLGVGDGHTTVTRITAVNRDADRMETTRAYGVGIPRGQGGRIATLVLGGMETTLDEIEYILQGVKEKKFVPKRTNGDIVTMCRMLAERRNAQVKYLRKNPSEAPKRKLARRRLYLPVGYRMADTSEPGFKIAMKV